MTFCRDFTQENQHFPTWPFFIFNAFFLFIPLPRWLTVIVGEEFPIDLRMLKSFRCLRPLKMVSKVPSKFSAISAHRDLAPASCRIKSRFLPRFQKNGNLDVESWIWDEKYLLMNTHTAVPSQNIGFKGGGKSVLDKWKLMNQVVFPNSLSSLRSWLNPPGIDSPNQLGKRWPSSRPFNWNYFFWPEAKISKLSHISQFDLTRECLAGGPAEKCK